MPVLVKRWRSVAIWVKSFPAGDSGNLTELAPEVLNSKALQSRNSQAAITSRCTALPLAIIVGKPRNENPWLMSISNTALFALRRTATAAPMPVQTKYRLKANVAAWCRVSGSTLRASCIAQPRRGAKQRSFASCPGPESKFSWN